MKKIIIFSVLYLVGGLASAQIEFNKSYADAQKNAKKSNKLLFVDFTASWCGPCKLMEKKVFSKKEVMDLINKDFIPVKVDVDLPEGKNLKKDYSIESVPTILIMNSSGKVLKRLDGYHDEKELLRQLKSLEK